MSCHDGLSVSLTETLNLGTEGGHKGIKTGIESHLVGEENPMDGDLEGFSHVCLHVDLDYPPPFSFSLNKGALLRNRFVTVHVKIDLFGRWIAVVPKHYLLRRSHASPAAIRVRSRTWY